MKKKKDVKKKKRRTGKNGEEFWNNFKRAHTRRSKKFEKKRQQI